MLALLAVLSVDAEAIDVPFPRQSSMICDSVNQPMALGAGGGGVLYLAGNKIQDKYLTGLASVSSLDLEFDMDDLTNAACPVGVLDFHVTVNGITVGNFSYVGGMSLGRITISESFAFAPIAGGGPGDGYKIRIVADDTVCGGGGSYNYFAGGLATLL